MYCAIQYGLNRLQKNAEANQMSQKQWALSKILEGLLVTLFPGWGCLIPLLWWIKNDLMLFGSVWSGGGGDARVGHFTPSWGPYTLHTFRVYSGQIYLTLLYRFFSWYACQNQIFFTLFINLSRCLFCFRHSFLYISSFALQYWNNIHPWWLVDRPAAALVFSCCSLFILHMDYSGLNQLCRAGFEQQFGALTIELRRTPPCWNSCCTQVENS